MGKPFVYIALILFCMASNLVADSDKVIKVYCEEWPGYTNRNGTGAYWEVIKAIYEPLGYKVSTSVFPWKRAKKMVADKQGDILVGDYRQFDSAATLFLYPRWHISIEDPVVAVIQRDSMPSLGIKNLAPLSGKRVGWVRGYGFESDFLKGMRFSKKLETTKFSYGIGLVLNGRLDAFLDYQASVDAYYKEKKISKQDRNRLQVVPVKLGSKLYAAFSNKPRSRDLVKIFDQQMTVLTKNGEIERIYKKWGLSPKKFGKDRFGD